MVVGLLPSPFLGVSSLYLSPVGCRWRGLFPFCAAAHSELSRSRFAPCVICWPRYSFLTQFCNPDIAHRDQTAWSGVRGFELRNVVANYPFESSRGFPGFRAEFRPWRSLAFELQRRGYAARGRVLPGSSASVSARTLAIMRRRREGTNWPRSLSIGR